MSRRQRRSCDQKFGHDVQGSWLIHRLWKEIRRTSYISIPDYQRSLLTFTHVGTAPDLAAVLRARWVDSPTEFKKFSVPLCGVGDDLGEEILETLVLENGRDEDRVGVREA